MIKLLTISQAARIKKVSRATIYAAIETGRIKAKTITVESFGIAPDELEKFTPNPRMQTCGRKASPSIR